MSLKLLKCQRNFNDLTTFRKLLPNILFSKSTHRARRRSSLHLSDYFLCCVDSRTQIGSHVAVVRQWRSSKFLQN